MKKSLIFGFIFMLLVSPVVFGLDMVAQSVNTWVKINSLTVTPFTQGNNGQLQAVIQNVGDVTALFDVGASCTSPFSISSTIQETPLLNINQETTLNIPITGGADAIKGSSEGTCTINVYSPEKPQNAVSKTVSVKVLCQSICTPNEKRCNSDAQEQCSKYGCSWEALADKGDCVKPCGGNSDCNDNNARTTDTCERSSCKFTPIQSPLIRIAIFLLVFLIIAYIIYRAIKKRKVSLSPHKGGVKEKVYYCKHCGAKISKGSKFCDKCGKKL